MVKWLRKFKRGSRHSGSPVPAGMFRLVILDDNPYPTYSGWREWCDGKPHWEDKSCQCAHEEAKRG